MSGRRKAKGRREAPDFVQRALFASVAALAVFGIAVRIRMGAAEMADHLPFAIGVVAAAAIYAAFRNGRSEALASLRWYALGAALAVLAGVFALGRAYRGGVFVAGGMNPTEAVKPLAAIFIAGVLAKPSGDEGRVAPGAVALAAAGCCALALGAAAVKDLGLLALLALTFASTLMAVSTRWGLSAFAVVGAGAAFAFAHPFGHLARRMAVWRDPFSDPTGAGWQTLHSLAAMTAGGWFGEGFGRGAVEAIPIAASDFVYAAIAEELGLVGCIALAFAYAAFAFFGLVKASRAPTRFRMCLAAALVSTVAVQVLVNLGGVTNAIPMTGITLPLISHGGSSIAVTLAACGLLLAL